MSVTDANHGSAVCLLDDDPSVLKSLRRLLAAEDLDAETFTDAEDFLAHVQHHQPKVVVIDMVMPRMHGLEVQSALRAVSPDTAVIVLTSKDEPELRKKAMSGGASAFFLKPPDTDFLAAIKSRCANQPRP